MTKPNIAVVLTAIGDDRPGLVEQLANAVSRHGANWRESSMSHLAGKFAGIVCIDVPESEIEALNATLAALPGLRIRAETSTPVASQPSCRRLKLSLVGHDRIGIVREVTQVLARHAVNVEELITHTDSAPMSATKMFHASAELTAAANLDAHALTADLERLSNDLMVDITLDETLRKR